MTIEIDGDKINLNGVTINLVSDGIQFDGYFTVGTGCQLVLMPQMGENQVYVANGETPALPTSPTSALVHRLSQASDGNAACVGSMATAGYLRTSSKSSTLGYTYGGEPSPGTPNSNIIEKIPFSVGNTGSDVGDLLGGTNNSNGQGSETFGYNSGSYYGPSPSSSSNVIQKFPYSSDTNASDVGNLTLARGSGWGISSRTQGYNVGGLTRFAPGPSCNQIDKFPFASDTNATDVGDLAQAMRLQGGGRGWNSYTCGIIAGGLPSPGGQVRDIQTFPFASDTNATDSGIDLSTDRSHYAASNGANHGYTFGGGSPPFFSARAHIEKVNYVNLATGTCIGDITCGTTVGGSGFES